MSNRVNNAAEQRIHKLLDEYSFMETGALVTARNTDFNLMQTDTPSDGVITGHGLIDGNLVFVYSQDASVLSGSIGEMHAKKIAAVYDKALQMKAPVIGLLDCAGLRLQESIDALDALGSIYKKQAQASGVVPQITAVFGNCGGGLTVIAGLSDFVFMQKDKAKLFVNSPNAIEGNRIEVCDCSSADFQSEQSGVVDAAGTEDEILTSIRELICLLPGNNREGGRKEACMDDLNRTLESFPEKGGDVRMLLRELSDGNLFFETRQNYATDMVTGFVRLNGVTVGVAANQLPDAAQVPCSEQSQDDAKQKNALLTPDGCEKAADFVRFCDAFEIPILSITDTAGFCARREMEQNFAKAVSHLTFAFASATVPKVNLLIGKAYGSAAVTMNSKAIGADMVYAWPDAKLGMMEAKLAAGILYAGEAADIIEKKAQEYEALQLDIKAAARRGAVDLIVEPMDSRKYLIAAFEMLTTKQADGPCRKHTAK